MSFDHSMLEGLTREIRQSSVNEVFLRALWDYKKSYMVYLTQEALRDMPRSGIGFVSIDSTKADMQRDYAALENIISKYGPIIDIPEEERERLVALGFKLPTDKREEDNDDPF